MKTLFRPVGEKEMLLIAENGFKSFPPRLEQQPIFYPVLNEEYASEIAEKWNTTDPFGNYLGFVTKFSITEEEFNKYQIENVGGKIHKELWVPSEELESFNESIHGRILITNIYIGDKFNSVQDEKLLELIRTHTNHLKIRLDSFLRTESRDIISFESLEEEHVHEEYVEPTKEEIEKADKEFLDLKREAHKCNTIEEAISFLTYKALDKETINKIKNETLVVRFSSLHNNHFGINRYLRNLFFYGNTNDNFLKSIEKEASHSYMGNRGEMGESVLEDVLWRSIHGYKIAESKYYDKIKIESNYIDKLTNKVKLKYGLSSDLLKEEYARKYDENFEAILKDFNELNLSESIVKIRLWSYDFCDIEIEKFLEIKNNRQSFEIYEKELLLAKLNDQEKEMFEKLRSDYINSSKVLEKIEKVNENRSNSR